MAGLLDPTIWSFIDTSNDLLEISRFKNASLFWKRELNKILTPSTRRISSASKVSSAHQVNTHTSSHFPPLVCWGALLVITNSTAGPYTPYSSRAFHPHARPDGFLTEPIRSTDAPLFALVVSVCASSKYPSKYCISNKVDKEKKKEKRARKKKSKCPA